MKRVTGPKLAKDLARLAKSTETAAVKRAHELLELIARRMQRITEDFYDIGTALRELQDKKLYAALGFASLGELLKARRLMSRSRAFELMHIVKTVPRKQALALGAEKSYALARLTAATKEIDTVEELVTAGVEVRGRKRSVDDLSVRELETRVREERVKSRHAKVDPQEKEAARVARVIQAALRKKGAREASVAARRRAAGWFLEIALPFTHRAALGALAR
ncbi:MAG: hypothetical protein HYV09_31890 [Deltaproteobacteria bacterium]|nr:hypothetical protein [Deltaproteobacteria bacterium]